MAGDEPVFGLIGYAFMIAWASVAKTDMKCGNHVIAAYGYFRKYQDFCKKQKLRGGNILKKIYLADDEKNIREIMTAFLENDGYQVQAFADGYSIRKAFDEQVPDMLILDIMMPGEDGLSLCSYFRKKSKVPIIIVSAKDAPMDRVTGILLGSDDYLTKPFLPLELAVRVKALFRRAELSLNDEKKDEPILCGNLCVIPGSRKVMIDGTLFKATPTEYEFLLYLIKRQRSAVSKKELLKDIWGYQTRLETDDSRASDDLVKRLRKKLRESGCTAEIETIWGYGYQMISR